MFIVAPISRSTEVASVIEAGADEIYCGLLGEDQMDNYANINCLNHRSEISSNLSSYNDLREVVSLAHSRNIPVNFTLNEFYDNEQVPMALMQLEKAIECGIDSVIVSDIGIMNEIKERKYTGLKMHISSCTTIMNSETIEFYKVFNPSRIILNRQLTIPEIKHMQRAFGGLEVEAFILNERCYNVDGLCTWLHGRLSPAYNVFSYRVANKILSRNVENIPRSVRRKLHDYVVENSHSCCFPYSLNYEMPKGGIKNKLPMEKVIFNDAKSFLRACGVCAIHDFNLLGIKFLKISGRALLANKITDVSLLKEAINILQRGSSKEDFCRKVRDIVRNRSRRPCSKEYCYYHDYIDGRCCL